MRQMRVKWGKFELELPGEIFFFLLYKAFPSVHNPNV